MFIIISLLVLKIIAASVTNLEENETNAAAAIADGSSEANRKGESQLSNVASTADIARSPEAAGKLPLGETAPAHGRLSTGISRNTPRVAASATPGHRKLSVKKVKGKKGEAESSPDVPVKECPYYTMITVEVSKKIPFFFISHDIFACRFVVVRKSSTHWWME